MHSCGNQARFCGITGEREGGRETREDDLEQPLRLRDKRQESQTRDERDKRE